MAPPPQHSRPMSRALPTACACHGFLAVMLLTTVAAGEDWPQFRGPRGDGHASANDLPPSWSETENVRWKVPIAGRGWSSPVIATEKIWLTTALDDGRSLRAICIDRTTGQVLHDVEVFAPSEPAPVHAKNSHASPTPVLEDGRVYVHFGAHGTACLSADGEILWKSNPWPYNHRHGPAGSPVLHGDLLIFSCDGTDVQFVVALDKHSGEVRWQTDRQGPMAYCTPQVIRVGGVDQLFSPGGNQAVSYDPLTGEELWRFCYTGYSVVPRPVYGHGLIFFSSGFDDPVLYAIRADGSGDVTDTHLAWELSRGAPNSPSPLLVGDDIYIVSDKGVATCLDARTGQEHWKQRIGGNYSASPLFADGRIHFLSEEGMSTVIAPGKTYQELAQNQLDGQTLASLAVAGRSIYLRSETHLYRIEKQSQSVGQLGRPAASPVTVALP